MADDKEITYTRRDSKRSDSSTSTSGYKLKPIDPASVNYWWHVLEGKRLVKVADYRFDPNVCFDSENSHDGDTNSASSRNTCSPRNLFLSPFAS